MATDSADEFRARAAQARRIADNMHNRQADTELRDMARALDEEADRLESEEREGLAKSEEAVTETVIPITNAIPPPAKE